MAANETAAVSIEVLSGPDQQGRYSYLKRWNDASKPFCAVCGRCANRKCPHHGTPEYGRCAQMFFGPLPTIAL